MHSFKKKLDAVMSISLTDYFRNNFKTNDLYTIKNLVEII